jgi:hypothetical protein
MKIQVTTKTHTQKDGTIWEWQETPELRVFIALQQSTTVQEALNERAS